ncbi:uncharacterized protein N7479_007760 [Penicillium vulpinum]|uniref:HTH CENPB-type domain-containing protein n=1 Tax=Penicillium vulpinum TaxID=29845 RepID=A0A1V6S9Q9_9EURO|nr:uncharacterized protein N7479_007760 [Penicillium vulpinum]KAJ5960610.1 hypothetical protein N7479_007760 [Penicillium vulpinum]OQE10782.1 hypothetical protein PENVUL_c003G09393 [Penicillium vulpinum]
MVKYSLEREIRVANAIKAYKERDKAKIAVLAREFDISYDLLRRRILGAGPPTALRKTLNSIQEKELDQWMTSLEAAHTPPTPGMVEAEANRILARDGIEKQVGRNWPYRFIARRPSQHPDLQRPLSNLNSFASNKDQIKKKIRKAIELLEEVADDLDNLSPKLRKRVTSVLDAGLTQTAEVARSENQSREIRPRQRTRRPVSRRVSAPETEELDED